MLGMSALGNYIKAKLKEQSLSQNELARRAGLSSGGLSMIISGKVTPKTHTLQAIADGLGIDPNPLFDISFERFEPKTELDEGLLYSAKMINSLSGNKRQAAIEIVRQIAETFKGLDDESVC